MTRVVVTVDHVKGIHVKTDIVSVMQFESAFAVQRRTSSCFNDARSVSLYPYNQSKVLQYVRYTKYINIAKECAFGQKVKTQQQQNEKSNIKPLPQPGIEPGTSSTQSRCITTAPPS